MAQKDMKKLVAYSSVSHLGFVMLGMFALNYQGLTGSVLQMINHGLSTGGLFLLVGIIYERRHTRMIADYGGLAKVMPIYATLFMIITMSSIGLPPLNGFIGEFTILVGAFNRSTTWAVLARHRHRARRGLHALDVPAGLLRRDHPRGEQGAEGRDAARAVDADPADRALLLDRALPQAVLPHPGALDQTRRAGGERRLRRAARCAQLAAPSNAGAMER